MSPLRKTQRYFNIFMNQYLIHAACQNLMHDRVQLSSRAFNSNLYVTIGHEGIH